MPLMHSTSLPSKMGPLQPLQETMLSPSSLTNGINKVCLEPPNSVSQTTSSLRWTGAMSHRYLVHQPMSCLSVMQLLVRRTSTSMAAYLEHGVAVSPSLAKSRSWVHVWSRQLTTWGLVRPCMLGQPIQANSQLMKWLACMPIALKWLQVGARLHRLP